MESEKEIHITSLAMLIKPKTSRTSRASVILLHIRSPPICGGVLLKSMVLLCSNEYDYGSDAMQWFKPLSKMYMSPLL